jgi:hypothetical protein
MANQWIHVGKKLIPENYRSTNSEKNGGDPISGMHLVGSQPKASSSKGKIRRFSSHIYSYKDHSMLTSSMHLMPQNSLPKT